MAVLEKNALKKVSTLLDTDWLPFISANGGDNGGNKLISWANFKTEIAAESGAFTDVITTSDTTESTSKDTGSIITEGGVGIEKSLFTGLGITAGTSMTATTSLTYGTLLTEGLTTSITAFAGGGQASATALTTSVNNVTVCATAGDSVKLPAAATGLTVTVKNSGATALDIFPASSDSIDALAVNLAVRILPGSVATFRAISAVVWESSVDASFTLVAPTTNTGQLQLLAAASAGNTVTTITNASQAAARTYTIPDAGGNASFAMTEGAQTINGAKTFGTGIALPDGTVGALSVRLGADGDNGIYGVSDTQMGFAVEGTLVGGANTTGLFTDVISEQVATNGVTVDGLLIKDGGASANSMFAGFFPTTAAQALSGAGAVNVTSYLTKFTSTGGADALTIASGTQIGQRKKVQHVVDGGSGVLTGVFVGGTTITFTAVAEFCDLIWTGSAWGVLELGNTAAPGTPPVLS